MPLSILQQRQQKVALADLCSAMDLIVIVSVDRILSVYRTISWEKIFSKSCDEFSCGEPTVVKFSDDGKHVVVGFSSPSHVLITLESQATQTVKDARRNSQTKGVQGLWWVSLGGRDRERAFSALLLPEVSGAENEESAASAHCSEMIVRQHENNELVFFAFGVTAIARWQGESPLHEVSLCVSPVPSLSGQDDQSKVYNTKSRLIAVNLDTALTHCHALSLSEPPQLLLHKLERLARVQMQINSFSRRIDELVAAASKKWKEAVKTIPLKLSLLQTLIEGYQLHLTPMQFLHSVSLCGMWHPAASTSFSQHWNEQGLSRLRSGIDAASLFVIRTLQLKVAPLASNIYLLTRTYKDLVQEILQIKELQFEDSWRENPSTLIEHSQHLAFAVDDAVLEAKRAREAFLVFIQFLRDGMQEATNNAVVDQDFTVRKQCARLFHNSRRRLDFSNPEHITGTFLCQHLQKIAFSSSECAKELSETKRLLSALSPSEEQDGSRLFAQKPLFEQNKVCRDAFEHFLEKPSPVLLAQRKTREIVTSSSSTLLASAVVSNSLPLSIALTSPKETSDVSLSQSVVNAQLFSQANNALLELLITVSDVFDERQQFYSRVRLPLVVNDKLKYVQTIIYNRNNQSCCSCAVLLIAQHSLVENGAVLLYRLPLSDHSFVRAEKDTSIHELPVTKCDLQPETFQCSDLVMAVANASRGVLCLADQRGRLLLVDLENEEDNDGEDDSSANSEA